MNHTIEEQLELHEGLRLKPYEDTVGKLTIGIGRNLDDKGISKNEAKYMLKNDIEETRKRLMLNGWFRKLDSIRQKVIIDMSFNLGYYGLMSFKKMIKAIKNSDYKKASEEMLNSKWANQVGNRADRLAKMMGTGEDYDT